VGDEDGDPFLESGYQFHSAKLAKSFRWRDGLPFDSEPADAVTPTAAKVK